MSVSSAPTEGEIRLSPDFTLAELCRSGEAAKRGLSNDPPEAVITRLRALCVILQRCRDRWGPHVVTSGYRSVEVNRIVGGAPDSLHRYGAAADVVPTRATVEEVWEWIRLSDLPFEQAIWERRPPHPGHTEPRQWLHLAIPRFANQPPARRAWKDHR